MQDETATAVASAVHRQLVELGEPVETELIQRSVHAHSPLLSEAQQQQVVEMVARLLRGLGPLETLLGDEAITELMVNGPGPVWVERRGAMVRTDVSLDGETLRVIIDRILAPQGLRVDRTAPFADARLIDGSRVNIAVPPLALDGPYLTIRRFRNRPFVLDDFCGDEMRALLIQAVRDRRSVVVSGGTGSGKTSLLNALAAYIEPGERVVTIEDAAELRFPGDHTVRLEARPANAEGVGHVPIRALLRNALRMRPDRLVVGEVRGAEAFDMIQAMNTGHDGSMSTCHANSPLDALRRIEAMALMADIDVPLQVMHEHVQSAVDLVVQVVRNPAGQRTVEAIYQCGNPGQWLVQDGVLVAPRVSTGAGHNG